MARNSESDNYNSNDEDVKRKRQIRLRRFPSTSKVETIVTEDEKLRRAQPDKPIHKPRDSILSWNSDFTNYEGLVNWAFLLLCLGGIRLSLENFNKYGIRVNPKSWIDALFGQLDPFNENREYPTTFLILYLNVPLFLALMIEKSIAGKWISWTIAKILHFVNLGSVLLLPVYVINVKYEHIGPAISSLACGIYAVLFLKLWSYIQVNFWCRSVALNRPQMLAKAARHPSLADFGPAAAAANNAALRKPRSSSMRNSFGQELIQYPDNLSLKDIYYFWFAPTLCYELNFPRSGRIRKMFLLRRALEVIVGTNITLALVQQWIIPSVVNSLIPFSNMDWTRAMERILKLALPNHLIWLTFFYLLFHSFLNTMGEILSFADRNFYNDWWNSDDIVVFWKTWNLPVHRWAVRHLYKPLLNSGVSAKNASFVVFFISAALHEYLVSVPLRMFKYYAFAGMLCQIPLMFVSFQAKFYVGKRAGNLLVWMSLILGQPLALMMYYHDFVVEHYGSELITTFGTM